MVAHNSATTARSFDVAVGDRHFSARLAAGAAATYRWQAPSRLAPAGDLGFVDLDFGPGTDETPTGRLVQSVGPDVLDQLTQVRLGHSLVDLLAAVRCRGRQIRVGHQLCRDPAGDSPRKARPTSRTRRLRT